MKDYLILIGLVAGWASLGELKSSAAEGAPESVTFVDGKVWAVTGADRTEATNEIVFPGEIKINTNGVFTVKGGKERQLKAQDVLASDGMLTSADGSVVPVQDHLAALRGRVDLVKDGDASPLKSAYRFPDGSNVQPDGRVNLPNGTIRRMLDGELYKLDGTSIPVTDTASLQGGKVVLFKDGGRIVLRPTQMMMMSDGTRVSGDGKFVRPDGSTGKLQEGEILKLPGVTESKKL